jgi:hypothetical protein
VDLVDELLREGLLGRDGGVLDDLAQLAGQLGEVGGGRWLLDGAGGKRLLELHLAGLQVGDLGAEGLDALAALRLWQGARLEGAQVALDGGFGLAADERKQPGVGLVPPAQDLR